MHIVGRNALPLLSDTNPVLKPTVGRFDLRAVEIDLSLQEMQQINVIVLELPYKLWNFAVLVFKPPKTVRVLTHTTYGIVRFNTRNVTSSTLHPLFKHLIDLNFFLGPSLCQLLCRNINCILNIGLLIIVSCSAVRIKEMPESRSECGRVLGKTTVEISLGFGLARSTMRGRTFLTPGVG